MPGAVDTSELFAALAAGSIVVAPSAAAARQLRELYDTQQRAAGLHAWEPAPVRSWSAWLDGLWNEAIVSGVETRLLLNAAQEHALWVEVVTASPADATLNSSDALASLAADAWRLASAYNATSRLREFAHTRDAQTFTLWAENFTRLCERRNLLPRSLLESALSRLTESNVLPTLPHLDLFGFDELTPAQSRLLKAFEVAGTQIVEHPLSATPDAISVRTVVKAANEQEELLAIAHWCRARIEREPHARIGVLFPADEDLAKIEAVLRDVLAPELQPIEIDLSSAPYEFTAGRPLAAFPILAPPLALARWLQTPLARGEVSALLLSPYLTPLADANQSAQFDACTLRQAALLRPEVELAVLLQLARESTFGEAPRRWLEPLSQFVQKANLTSLRAYAEWTEFFRALARAAGWPGERELSSHEFQATRAWDDVLDLLATLDFQGKRISFETALAALERLAGTASFAPPPTHAPVQILTPETAVGLSFDAVIVARAADENFPPAERPHSLLGFGLQASLGMPGASQARATARAQQLVDRLLASAPEVLFTFAAETPEGAQRLAPLVARLGWPQHDAFDLLAGAGTPPVQEESVEDTAPLPPLPSPLVRGGSRVLQRQAACGFSAFAEFRLRSTELDAAEAGFDAAESGTFVHRVLDHFWQQTKSQQYLARLTLSEREERLSVAIDAAFQSRVQPASDWDKAYVALQKERLVRLLQRWLDFELKRGEFTVVQAEKDQLLSIGPLDLKLRIDRMDEVDGGVFLVDYKTGASARASHWNQQRPDEPQLPLYALIPEADQLKGLAFAKIRAGKQMEWSGFEAAPGYLSQAAKSRSVVDLPQRIAEWRATLEALAQDFFDGDAGVSPKKYPATCTYCAQRLLCRLDPASLLADTDSDEDNAGEHDG